MRAAALLGPGSPARSVATFQRLTGAEWTSLIEQADVAVIFGGDGTVHRHLAELVELEIPVLVVPCGSGNDFARALKIHSVKDAAKAWKSFAAGGKAQTIDLGMITPQGGMPADQKQSFGRAEAVPFRPVPVHGVTRTHSDKAPSEAQPHHENSAVAVLSPEVSTDTHALQQVPQLSPHYFCCVAGIGIDTEIARRANDLPKWLRARGGYALSAPAQLLRFAPFRMKVSRHDDKNAEFHPTILAAIANAPAYGGGMKIAPKANLGDGKLDVCIVRSMNAFRLFCLFPTVYFGRHLGFEEVDYEQTECVRIETEVPVDVYADGEYACQTPVEFSVARGALNVLTP
jgi:diacylglycerol kinase family enzyme